MKKVLTSLLILGMVFTGCTKEILQELPDGNSPTDTEVTGEEATIRFNINQNTYTKSSISIDEGQLSNVNIFAYCDGLLYSNVYSTTPETVSMKLKKGTSYNLYAVANMGAMDAMAKEEDFIKNFAVTLNSISDMNGKNPLSWSYEGYSLSSASGEINMEMNRLYSKVNFTLDKGTLRGLEIKSVKLCQAARTVRPFSRGGSRALTGHDIMEGDYASASDLEKLNSTGEGVFFYTLENRQGTMLPSNTDPWKKIPENIQAGNLCTYIEVQATFKEGFFYSGDVTYRFYLGQDSTTNFDIIRNNDMNVALILTGDNFGEGRQNISWKVYSNTDLNPNGFCTFELKHLDNSIFMFVGERFELDATLSADLYNHIDQNPDNVVLHAVYPGNTMKKDCIKVESMTKISSGNNGCKLRFTGTITKVDLFTWALFDKRSGKKLANFSSDPKKHFRISPTHLVISQHETCNSVNDTILGTSLINGPVKTYYVHALSRDPETNRLRNANKTGVLSGNTPAMSRSIDLEMFKGLNIKYLLRQKWWGLDENFWENPANGDKDILIKYTPAPANGNAEYVGSFKVYVRNDGTGDQTRWQNALGGNEYLENYMYGDCEGEQIPKWHNLGFTIDPTTLPTDCKTQSSKNAFLSIVPAKVRLKFNAISAYEYSLSYIVDNPSKVPFKFRTIMEMPIDMNWMPGRSLLEGMKLKSLFYEREKSSAYKYNLSRFISHSSFNTNGETDSRMTCINGNEFKLNETFLQYNTENSPTRPPLHISIETFFGDKIDYPQNNGGNTGRLWEDIHFRMRDDMLDFAIENNPNCVVNLNRGVIYNASAARLDLSSRHYVRYMLSTNSGNSGSPLLEFEKYSEKQQGNIGYVTYGGVSFGYGGVHKTEKWSARLNCKAFTTYKHFGEGPTRNETFNITNSTGSTDWEMKYMRYFIQPSYKKEYWHTLIHNKAGHHIVYPRVYQVNMDIWIQNDDPEKPGRGTRYSDLHYLDWSLPATYTYRRDHIQVSEKNDDSFYDYTVTVNATYHGAKVGDYYHLYHF